MITLLLSFADAAVPLPTYPECGEPDRPDLCPSDLGEAWSLLSYVPAAWAPDMTASERALGAGMWVDRAWRTTTGRPDVVIAILDSGIEWDRTSLLKKHHLNVGELPLPEGASSPDANGDGVVNIDDWASDTRVRPDAGVDRADDVLDPSDLIHTFSDGVDDDGNGYVDDISGWDFFWNDNDPYDDTRYGHGTGMATDAAAEGGDGDNTIGVCPSCMVLNLRVSDSFISDGSAFGLATHYAIDQGAAVISESLGALSHSRAVDDAIDRAWSKNILVIGSAGDETAWHPNPPGRAAHTFYVHGIHYNADDPEDATSFLAYENCTNHGARLDGSAASSGGCSSGATAHTAGVAALILSAARDAGIELSAGELHALLSNTVDDINLGTDDPERYPSGPGWDTWFGHGRLNAARAVEAVAAGEVPPVVDILSPAWFGWGIGGFTLDYEASARDGVASATVEYGVGLEPTEWIPLPGGDGEVITLPAVGGPLTDYTLGLDTVAREALVNTSTVTLRLTVTDTAGRSTVARRAIYLHDDPDLVSVRLLEGSLEASPTLADLDGDGVVEILQPDGAGYVHVLTPDGELPGWPVTTERIEDVDPDAPGNHLGAPTWSELSPDLYAPAIGAAAVGDLDGDGAPDVVVASLRGVVHAWSADGQPLPGFPVEIEAVGATDPDHVLDEGFLGSPALGDLDGDGALEIVAGGMDGQVYAWTGTGDTVPGFPMRPVFPRYEGYTDRIVSAPALGDLDGDGDDEIVIGTNETLDYEHAPLYAIDGDGSILPGWPVMIYGLYVDVLPMVGEGQPGAAALGDLDGDGALEVVAHALAGDLVVLSGSGEAITTFPTARSAYGAASNVADASILPLLNSPSLGDLDDDGTPDVVTGASGVGYLRSTETNATRIPFDHAVGAWSGKDGSFLPGFPRVVEDLQFFQNPSVADLDGDGDMEAITGSGGFVVHAWDAAGNAANGWPKLAGEWIIASPAVGDVDGDGWLDVVVGTRDGKLFTWRTDSPAGARTDWPMYGHDARHTRNLETPLEGYNAGYPTVDEEPEGCGCGGGEGAALLVLAGLLRRRRR